MGNIAFVSFKKNVTDEMFHSMLLEVANSIFNKALIVYDQHAIGARKGIFGDDWSHILEYYRYGPRKFGSKHPHGGETGHWIHFGVTAELCVRFGATLSDEGCSGTWKNDPNKYKTYKDFLKAMYVNTWNEPVMQKILKQSMRRCPKDLLVLHP